MNEIWGGGKSLEKRVKKLRRVVRRIGEEVGRLEGSDGRGNGRDGGIYFFQPAIPVTFEINTWFAATGGGGGGSSDDGRRRRGYTEQELLQARDVVQEKTNIRVFEKLAEGKFPGRILREEREEEEEEVRKLEGLSTTGVEEDGGCRESGQQAGNATADAANNSEKTESLSAHYFGWGLSSLTENLDDEVFVKGYVELWKELVRIDEGREGIVG